ncbi:MAG: acetyltransferase, partial [Burkholderiales bacterium]|nr:acetyltransferase [Burkholderiales bacterium]
MHYDVFNGDADGLCALQQLRLAEPLEAELVSGAKRDIALLERPALEAAGRGDRLTVLDISLDRNRAALERLLARGARLTWFDHHFAGAVPAHPALEAHIDASPEACTSIVVDRHLGGRFRAWAVAAAFGDGLGDAARALARRAGLGAQAVETLRALGEALNYNGYGASEADLTI